MVEIMQIMQILFIAIFIISIARLVNLYGRSAYEAGEYGGNFIPSFRKELKIIR